MARFNLMAGRRFAAFLVVFFFGGAGFAALADRLDGAEPPTLLLISIDGFRADYLDRGQTPTLARLAKEGVRAKSMRPAFPTLTFPNHYTLVTGLYPDHHGIIENTMEDETLQPSRFKISDPNVVTDRHWWDQGTPLWVSVHRQGGHSATMFWPGSEADIQGIRPDYWLKYDAAMPYEARVDTVLQWLDLPREARPQFLTLYFEGIDSAGHHAGIDSPQMSDALVAVDQALQRLWDGLEQRGLTDKLNLIILADHGMTQVSNERVVFIDDLVPRDDVTIIHDGALMSIKPNPGAEQSVEAALLRPLAHIACYRKQDLPKRLHYGHNARVAPLLCVAEQGWVITTREWLSNSKDPWYGTHGYDNAIPDMQALFVAHGPAFKRGLVHAPFDNVDVYPLMAHILGVKPEPNDGHFKDVKDMLRKP